MIPLLVALGSLCLVLWMVGSFNQALADEEWSTVLSPAGRQAFAHLHEMWRLEEDLVDWSYERAANASAERVEALRLLAASYDYLAALVPDRTDRLKRMALYSRLVLAIAPLPPVRPSRFRLSGVAAAARLGVMAHHFLVATGERFRLRLFVLRQGFRLVLRTLLDTQRRLEAEDARAEWDRILAARHDFRRLDDETIESCRVLVAALGTLSVAPQAS